MERKESVLKELEELSKLGVVPLKLIEEVKRGDWNDIIEKSEGMKVVELADYIHLLHYV